MYEVCAEASANVASYLELGVNVDSDGVPLSDIERELSVRSDDDGRSRACCTILDTVDHIAISPSRKARLETRVPVLIQVVDCHESGVSASKSNALGSRREPVRHSVRFNDVPEPDHSGDGSPTMLAVPSVSSVVSVASAVVAVRTALIGVTELVTGQDGGTSPRVSQDPNVSEDVRIVRRVGGQRCTTALRVVVGDECVRSAARVGRVT